ncbi:hypothetical protein HK098_004700, partial [Nowakowskiella sp. JEL0407]
MDEHRRFIVPPATCISFGIHATEISMKFIPSQSHPIRKPKRSTTNTSSTPTKNPFTIDAKPTPKNKKPSKSKENFTCLPDAEDGVTTIFKHQASKLDGFSYESFMGDTLGNGCLRDSSRAMFSNAFVMDRNGVKNFDVEFQISTPQSDETIAFTSPYTTVLSKPSNKQTQTKTLKDDEVYSGMIISLHNRSNSQSSSTKFLQISTRNSRYDLLTGLEWTGFRIWLTSEFPGNNQSHNIVHKSPLFQPGFYEDPRTINTTTQLTTTPPKSIFYGDEIVLESIETGLVTVPFIIRRVFSNGLLAPESEESPVCQMQKIILQLQTDHSKILVQQISNKKTDQPSNNQLELIDIPKSGVKYNSDVFGWTIVGI